MAEKEKETFKIYVRGVSKPLRNRIKAAAKESGRSVNGEILKLLERTYSPKKNEKGVDDGNPLTMPIN